MNKNLVIITFDLIEAQNGDYDGVYRKLESIGLTNEEFEDRFGNSIYPTSTMVVGEREGEDEETVLNEVLVEVRNVFEDCEVEGDVFGLVSRRYATFSNQFE